MCDEVISVMTENDRNEIRKYAEMIMARLKCDDNGWISVKDALPELKKDVLVYAVGKEVGGMKFSNVTCITCYTNILWIGHAIETDPYWKSPWQYFNSDYDVKFWQYLPEPPEVKENGTD